MHPSRIKTKYCDLNETEKILVRHIESVYIDHPSVDTQTFLKSLKFLLEKYKKTK